MKLEDMIETSYIVASRKKNNLSTDEFIDITKYNISRMEEILQQDKAPNFVKDQIKKNLSAYKEIVNNKEIVDKVIKSLSSPSDSEGLVDITKILNREINIQANKLDDVKEILAFQLAVRKFLDEFQVRTAYDLVKAFVSVMLSIVGGDEDGECNPTDTDQANIN